MPSLVLDDGEVLIDSAAILDWLDQDRRSRARLLPPAGAGRTRTPSVAHAARDRTSGGPFG
jgi:glutathione S-transferase